MNGCEVKVTFDKQKVITRLKAASGKALYITSEQALKDCNKYCPKDQGMLIASSITHSQPEKGILKWNTPYARALYYGYIMVDPATGKACFKIGDQMFSRKGVKKVVSSRQYKYSGQGRKMWTSYAHSMHGKQWKKTFQDEFCKEAKPK